MGRIKWNVLKLNMEFEFKTDIFGNQPPLTMNGKKLAQQLAIVPIR